MLRLEERNGAKDGAEQESLCLNYNEAQESLPEKDSVDKVLIIIS